MKGYEARVLEGPHGFVRNQVTIAVLDLDRGAYLMSDGTWQVSDEASTPGGIGVVIPAAAVEAIGRAIEEWQGHTSHAGTEARVLREWLAVEQHRVQMMLERT